MLQFQAMANYPEPLRKLASVIVILTGILAVAFGLSCSPEGYSGPAESITIGVPSAIGTATYLNIAQEQGFFGRNGLNVTVRGYQEGLNALDGLLAGDVDVAGAAEYPVVGKAFNKDGVRIIAGLDKGGTFFLTGRKDRGIESIADLKGKRIGVTARTINEFYLGRLLNLNGVQIGDVTRVNLTLAQLEDALAGGSVDAVMSREPFLSSIKKRLGANGIGWSAQSYQPTYGLLASRDDWITQHPGLVKRFLKSLAQAEEYIVRHPAETEAMVERILNYDKEAVASLRLGLQFSLSLDQSLIVAMEDEARWMIDNNLTTEKLIPDFVNYIYVDGLKAVKPGAVNIIR
ncbi:MAG: NrtA/SsuA/CpmA family ABC transporter substrate-binding protein [Chloroflexi bacterium]|nr:NrtA/SsuA/CpmA family ABC transporter substrate-binding protein [Chloroflexota bacterium]